MNSTRRSRSDQTSFRDSYQEVTDRIIAALENGVVPWRRPWDPVLSGRNTMPSNATTGRFYRGINILMLALSPFAWSTGDNRWCSYKQAAERGWQVRKGERGTTVFFSKTLERKDSDGATELDGGGNQHLVRILRAFTVFHASQMDGIPAVPVSEPHEVEWHRPEAVETILCNSRAVIRIGGSQAFYNPSSDHIQLPPHEALHSPEAWSATALHELSHWTGDPSRLDRDLSGKFGTAHYAEEELRADLASCFMGNTLGLPCDIPNHASYLQGWLSKLRDDKREIFRAAAAAQRIADFCLAFHPDYAPVSEDVLKADSDDKIAA